SRARQNFTFETGLPADVSLTPPAATASTTVSPLPNYLERAASRPDLKALELQTQAAQRGTSYARAGHMPTLNLLGNGYWTKDANDRELEWDIGLGLTIPIFEGGAVQGRVREAKAIETEAELTYRRLKRSTDAEVTQAHQSLASSIRQINSLQDAVTSSEKNYREQTRDYGFGLVTNIEVLTALNTLQDARRSLDRTRFESLLYMAQLNAAIHEIPDVKTQEVQR
ncbi:MAG: TolC family protein, partial [Bdellovibrionota bacterium]